MPNEWGKSPVSVFEITQPMCAESYGVAPCAASGADQCQNTFATCQDTANYNQAAEIKLRFREPGAREIEGEYIIPSLGGPPSTAPSVINPAGASRTSGPIGQRAVCKVKLMDHPHSDLLVDPYRTSRAYNPGDRSTFWRKWLARNPYHEGYLCRVYDGYEGQTLAEMQRRDYIIDKISGPSNGLVTVTAKDPLKLADNVRAQAPLPSTGLLSADISASATTFTIYDTLNGDYPAPGTVRIGEECMTYTGSSFLSGVTTLTGVVRGTDGTTADTHDADDSVQWCLRISSVPAWEVARDLLVDYAGVPPAYIPYTDWNAECSLYIPGFTVTTLITDPEGVNTLLGELCQQCLFYIWWDERDSQIKLRTVRTFSSPDININDDDNILEDSLSIDRRPEERVSQVWIYYLRRDATRKLDETANYRVRRVRADLSAESDNEYGTPQIKKIFSRWLESDAQAITVGARILNVSREVRQHVSLRLDAKDRALWTGGIADMVTHHIVDSSGLPGQGRYQVMSAEEIEPGETLEYEMVLLQFGKGAQPRPAIYMADGSPTYAAATEAQRENGGWYSEDGGTMSDGSPGYTYQ